MGGLMVRRLHTIVSTGCKSLPRAVQKATGHRSIVTKLEFYRLPAKCAARVSDRSSWLRQMGGGKQLLLNRRKQANRTMHEASRWRYAFAQRLALPYAQNPKAREDICRIKLSADPGRQRRLLESRTA